MLLIALALFLNSVFAADYCTLCENRSHTLCQFKEGPAETCINYTKLLLTPAEKMYILDIHNDIRNHVASGHESRGALGNQPAAGDMVLLKWNEELAKIAQRWVDRCLSVNATMQHDICRRTVNFEVGQNVVTAITPDGQLPELSVLILSWYKQIMYVIPSDIDEFTGLWKGKHQIGQYTQLVWAKTRYLGCAAAAFKETVGDPLYNVRLVCNYGPAGNVIGDAVYQRGRPCSRCRNRVCDTVRLNLCGDLDKNTIKQIAFYRKYKDKATTLSNMIDIEDPKIDVRFVNFSILNMSDTRKSNANMAHTTEFINYTSTEWEKDINVFNSTVAHTTVKDNDNFTYTYLTDNKSTAYKENSDGSSLYKFDINVGNLNNNTRIIENEDYLNISGYDSLQTLIDRNYTTSTQSVNLIELSDNLTTSRNTDSSNKTDSSTAVANYRGSFNLSQILPATTLAGMREKSNLKYKVTFVVTINLLMESFLNQSNVPDILEKFEREDASIIDLNKNKCERKVKLNNDITLVQDCENDTNHLINPGRKFPRQLHARGEKIRITGNDVILPGNRRFKRATGVWTNGHCRCIQFVRSCSTILHVIRYLSLATSIVHFLTK